MSTITWLVFLVVIGSVAAGDDSIEAMGWQEAIAELTSKQRIDPAKVEELLVLIDKEAPNQKELNVKKLVGACVPTNSQCGQRDFLRMEFYMLKESLFAYLQNCAQKRRVHCEATYLARFDAALSQIDNQVKADVGQLLEAWQLPEEHYTIDGMFKRVPSNQIRALIGFVQSETRKNLPDSKRRYHSTTTFEELSVIAIEACKEFRQKMSQALDLYKVPESVKLSGEHIKWIVATRVCEALHDQFDSTWILARDEFQTLN